jgi:hypothetical protein
MVCHTKNTITFTNREYRYTKRNVNKSLNNKNKCIKDLIRCLSNHEKNNVFLRRKLNTFSSSYDFLYNNYYSLYNCFTDINNKYQNLLNNATTAVPETEEVPEVDNHVSETLNENTDTLENVPGSPDEKDKVLATDTPVTDMRSRF